MLLFFSTLSLALLLLRTNKPGFLHIHPNVDQENWVQEFSQYDAGWLHFFKSENYGEIKRSTWDDLNIPARMSTLALSGIPMLQADNTGHIVATQSILKKLNLGLLFNEIKELGHLLRNRELMLSLRKNVWEQRRLFMFDHHVGDLVEYFKAVIESRKNKAHEQTNGKPLFPAVHHKAVADKTYHRQPNVF